MGNYALTENIEFEFEYVDNNTEKFDLIFGEYSKLNKLSLTNITLPETLKNFYDSNEILISNNLLPLDLDTYILTTQIDNIKIKN